MADAMNIAFGSPVALASESSLGFTNQALGTIDYKLAHCFAMPKADTLTHIGFRYGLRTSTPPQHTASLQGLGTSGLPSGTILGGGTPASGTFTPPADTTWDGTFQWVALANSYAAAADEKIASVIDCTSSPAGGSSSFTRSTASCLSYLQNFPYPAINTGSWAKSGNVYQSVFAVKSASAVYGFPLQGLTTRTTATSGQRLTCKFTLPADWGSTYKIKGFRLMNAATAAAANTYQVGLWNAAGTALQNSATVDSDHIKQATGVSDHYFGSALATLDFGTAYYIGFECESSNTVRMMTLDFSAANDLLAYPLGTNACYSSWNGSSWTDISTSRPWLELIIDDWTEPSGGGGDGTVSLINGGVVL